MKSKIISILFTILIIFFSVLPLFLIFPQRAEAGWVTDLIHIGVTTAEWTWQQLKDAYNFMMKSGGAIAYRNVVNTYMAKIAQQTSEWAATGFKGSKPMFLQKPDKFREQLEDDIMGEFIDQVAQGSFLNQSLCDPIDPTVKLRIILSLKKPEAGKMREEELCSLSTIKKRVAEASHKHLFEIDVDLTEGNTYNMKTRMKSIIDMDKTMNTAARSVAEVWETVLQTRQAKIEYAREDLNEALSRIGGSIVTEGEKDLNYILETLTGIEIEWGSAPDRPEREEFIKIAKKCAGKKEQTTFCYDDSCLSFCSSEGNKRRDHIKCIAPDLPDLPNSYYKACLASAQKADTIFSSLKDWERTQEKMIEDLKKIVADQQGIANIAGEAGVAALDTISKAFSPQGTDLGAIFTLLNKEVDTVQKEVSDKKFAQGLAGMVKNVVGTISGETITPAPVVERRTAELGVDPLTKGGFEYTGALVADTLNVVATTYFNYLLKQLFEGPVGLNPALSPEGVDVTKSALKAYKPLYQSIGTVKLIKGGAKKLLEEEYALCDPSNLFPTNCVADIGLATAAQEELTISEAMNDNKLHADWGIVGEKTLGNPEATQQYSLNDIKKLRRARVVPLGLEIAAQEISEGKTKSATLKNVVNGFSDKESPFYHLVNPNWVLKSLPFNCAYQGYSDVTIKKERQEICLDWQDCLAQNDEGDCQAYGYCLAEKNIWRFNGDSCDSQNTGCTAFKRTSDGKQFSYLSQTLDTANCNINNVGCQWYCQDWNTNLGENGLWACVTPGMSYSREFEKEKKNENVIFFNRAVSKCEASNEGCSEFIRISPGLNTNLLPNGDFRYFNGTTDDDKVDEFLGWEEPQSYLETFSISIENESAIKTSAIKISTKDNGGPFVSDPIKINSQPWKRYFTSSADIKVLSSGTGKISFSGSNFTPLAAENTWNDSTDEWQTVWQTIELKPNQNELVFILTVNTGRSEIQLKNAQVVETYWPILEANTLPNFKTYGDSNSVVYYKEAPDYYHCYDSPQDNDDGRCPTLDPNSNFLKSCQEKNVGCELFTPLSGFLGIPAIVNANNYCAPVCDGYNIFRQQATNFDVAQDGLAFIPSTAKTCPVREVGCEEFTNLDLVKEGGEGKEYYSYLRQCIKIDKNNVSIIGDDGQEAGNDDSCAYYYTWIGSEEAGYQLQKHLLKKGEDGPADLESPSPLFGLCRNEFDAITNLHCKQFYTADGKISYHLWENTISCSEDCHPYRKTIPAAALNNRTLFMAIPSQGQTCASANVGCREYKGPTANNWQQIFLDNFDEEGQVTELWGKGVAYNNVSWSEESTNQEGHSMEVKQGSVSRPLIDEDDEVLLDSGYSYKVSFWVKGEGDYQIYFDNQSKKLYPKNEENILEKNALANQWQELKFDAIYVPSEFAITENTELVIEGPNNFYIDNISLTKIQNNLYLIKNSWYTPIECTSETIGCEGYQDRAGQTHYLHSFASLCDENEVGCQALIKTQNFDSPFKEKFNTANKSVEDDITVPADELVYRILDGKSQCSVNKKGCERFGKPSAKYTPEVPFFDDNYLINDPNNYTKKPILCYYENENCEAYNIIAGNGPAYFKDPEKENKICAYSTDQAIEGWYKKENGQITGEACYPKYIDERTFGIYSNKNSNYDGYVGECPFNQAGCTEFLDPLGKTIWFEDFEEDKDGNGVTDGWFLTCGGSAPGSCNNIDKAVPAGNRTLSGENNIHGAKHQKLVISDNVCEEQLKDGTCKTQDVVFNKAYTKQQIESMGIKPGRYYTFTAYGKITPVSGNTDSWKLHVRPRYKLTDNFPAEECSELEKQDSNWKLDQSNNTYTCYYENVSSTLSGKGEWEENSVRFSIPEEYWNNLEKVEFNLRGPKETGTTIEYDYLHLRTYTPYYYLDNDKIDRSQCVKASPEDGCVFFYNSQKNEDEILKVKRDRECGQWLSCVSYVSEWVPSLNSNIKICDAYRRCDKLKGQGIDPECAHFVDPPNIYYDKNGKLQPLSKENYQNRDISWGDLDYSGYTLYNTYPIEELRSVYDKGTSSWVLGYSTKENKTVGIDGESKFIPKTCRIFPEYNSPFSASECEGNTNCCLPDSDNNPPNAIFPECQCHYVKADYSGQVLYFNYGNTPWEGFKNINNTNKSCDPNEDQFCFALTGETAYMGQRGYCLEADNQNKDYCITWYPGMVMDVPDIYQRFETAGYKAASHNQWYCTEKLSSDASKYEIEQYECRYMEKGTCHYEIFPVEKIGVRNTGDCEDKFNCAYNEIGSPYYCLATPEDRIASECGTNKFGIELKMKDIEKIEVKLGADDGDPSCTANFEARKWVELNKENGWTGRVIADDDGTVSKKWDCSCPDGGTVSKIKACFSEVNVVDGKYNCDNDDLEGTLQSFIWLYRDRSTGPGKAKFGDDDNKGIKIYLKNSCKVAVKIADDSGNNKAFTNRVNNVKNYYGDAENINGKTRGTLCTPWGWFSHDNLKEYVLLTQEKPPSGFSCYSNALREDAIYSSQDIQNNLFAKSYKKQTFDINTYTYNESTTDNWNVTVPGKINSSYDHLYPQVASVIQTTSKDYTIGKAGKITINNKDEGSVSGVKMLPVSLKFYAWADKDHMPIREVQVDWDDDDDDETISGSSEMMAKNHKPICCESNVRCNNLNGQANTDSLYDRISIVGDKCDGEECLNFGNIPDACISTTAKGEKGNAYFLFYHIYFCEEGKECSFNPKVYVKDNWGWCNGGVYADDEKTCLETAGAGTSFGGSISIHPIECTKGSECAYKEYCSKEGECLPLIETCSKAIPDGIGYTFQVDNEDKFNECNIDGCGTGNCSGSGYYCGYITSGNGKCPICKTCKGATSPECKNISPNIWDERCDICQRCDVLSGTCAKAPDTKKGSGQYGCTGSEARCFNGECLGGKVEK